MTDEMKPPDVQTSAPVSPTGTPLISPKLAPYLFAATTLCTVVAGASQMNLGLPPQVFGWAMIGAAFFGAMLAATPGFRKAAPMVLLVLSLGFASCATEGSALLITSDSLDMTAKTFDATATTLEHLNAAGQLTAKQRADYNRCLPVFKESYHAACRIWRAAAGSEDKAVKDQVEALITVMLGEVQPFIEIAAAAHAVDGGAQ